MAKLISVTAPVPGAPMTRDALLAAERAAARVWTHDGNGKLRRASFVHTSVAPAPGHVSLLVEGMSYATHRRFEHVFATTTDYWLALTTFRSMEGFHAAEDKFFDAPSNHRYLTQLRNWRYHANCRYLELLRALEKREEKALANRLGYRLPVVGEAVRYHAFAPMNGRTQAESFYPAVVVGMSCDHPMHGWTLRVFPPALFVLPGEPYEMPRVLGDGDPRLGVWTHYPPGEAPPLESRR